MRGACGRSWYKFVLMAVVGIAVAGLIVMGLWNWLAPALFGWKQIHFLQALGLLVLARLLFGRFHGHPGMHTYWRRHMEQRWNDMSPEEREKFRTGMRSCWGGKKSTDQVDET